MKQKKSLTARNQPKQERSKEMQKAILTSATYILEKHGLTGFTTNKVAEKAGVNISSLYQYYRNKQSLLFHLHEIEWNENWSYLQSILSDESMPASTRFKKTIIEFFRSEAKEAKLRRALEQAQVLFEQSKEYRNLEKKVFEHFLEFMRDFSKYKDEEELLSNTRFILNTVTGFASRVTSGASELPAILNDAERLSRILILEFRINE
jgi:AcrR family transcriptional regulator